MEVTEDFLALAQSAIDRRSSQRQGATRVEDAAVEWPEDAFTYKR
jgi:predicted transcriptional regulator